MLSWVWRVGRSLARRNRIRSYYKGGARPWSVGYTDVKYDLIRSHLRDAGSLSLFRAGHPLPSGFGSRIDERVVEYPWVFARLDPGAGRLLDAGSTLNHELFLSHPLVATKHVTITTLAPEPHCYWSRGVSYDFEDLRHLPYRDQWFDEVICISTLEHVGMDNTMWGGSAGGDDFGRAAQELVRVLRRGGRLLITVPFGISEDIGFQRQFDGERLDRLINELAPCAVTTSFFRYTPGGWIASDRDSSSDAVYFNIHERGYGRGRVRYDPDHAAAARAVACLDALRPA